MAFAIQFCGFRYFRRSSGGIAAVGFVADSDTADAAYWGSMTVLPPSIMKFAPVIKDASSEAR